MKVADAKQVSTFVTCTRRNGAVSIDSFLNLEPLETSLHYAYQPKPSNLLFFPSKKFVCHSKVAFLFLQLRYALLRLCAWCDSCGFLTHRLLYALRCPLS